MHDRMPAKITRSRRVDAHRECPAHRAWVRRHHCSVPGCKNQPIECAHVRLGTNGGIGLKPSDRFTISLCRLHHAEQHQIGEAAFQKEYGMDLLAIARDFARRSPHWLRLDS